MIGLENEELMEILVVLKAYWGWGWRGLKTLKFYGRNLKIGTDFCDGLGKGLTHGNLGNALHFIDEFWKAMEYVKKHLDIALKTYEITYNGLWRSAPKPGKIEEALLAAERGRAQALSHTLIIQYKLAPPFSDTTSK
ncbi:hypothetical protein P5673_020895, partial [Acropora cervicornis]